MFIRRKDVGGHSYLQLVENRWEEGKTRQRVVASLGRLDRLQESGSLGALQASLGQFAGGIKLQQAHARGDLQAVSIESIGPGLVFGRLWQELEIDRLLTERLAGRRFEFPVERAVFATVLHRLFEAGSDRQGFRFLRDVRVPGTDELGLHHLYRAMRFLGEEKDAVEEALFSRTRDLFSDLRLVFFDTTSLYFHGAGGDLGAHGHSRDHRPELRQVVVGALLGENGRPISCEVLSGDQADVTALLPVVDRARERFGLSEVCFVADRGMVSAAMIAALEKRGMGYILGARMRQGREVRDEVLSRSGRYRPVGENLQVKEVVVEGRRYIVCRNPKQAAKDAADREVILAALEEKLAQGAKALVGNRGFRRYLRVEKGAMRIDARKVDAEARYDGKWVLRTNQNLPAAEVALQYKRLLQVEQFFRTAKDLLQTRPIFHKFDSTLRGHIFVSFLALVLWHELDQRLAKRGGKLERADVVRDVQELRTVEVEQDGKRYALRSPLQGVCGKVLQAVGVAVPPPVREAPAHGAKA